MLSHADNMRICQVGAGSPMGEAMRRYWIPALETSRLPEPDCPPVRLRMLGENFVAFRNTEGDVGVIDEQCKHRNASLALGRVEDCGVRCLFHGWLFAPDGTLLETPNVSDVRFKARFRTRACSVREAAGYIWIYMGPKEQEPPFPNWYFMKYPSRRLQTASVYVKCNYVQLQEAALDSSHLTILHADVFKRGMELAFNDNLEGVTAQADPVIEVEETDFGMHYGAMRRLPTPDGLQIDARVTSFIAPFCFPNANGDFVAMVVPIDDNHCVQHHIWWSEEHDLAGTEHGRKILEYTNLTPEILAARCLTPETWGNPNSPSIHNAFYQDRDRMKNGSWTGLPPFFPEDVAMLESSGAIRDRTRETLAPADIAVARLYRVLLRLIRSVEDGEIPLGQGVDLSKVRGLHGLLSEGGKWTDLVPDHATLRRGAASESVAALT